MKPLHRSKTPDGNEASEVSSSEVEAIRTAIEVVLRNYETALNGSDVEGVVSSFEEDGVFMPQHGPATIGAVRIRAAYEGIFETITFDTELAVEEIVPVASNWAFVRTSSAGSVNVKAIGQRVPDANHELFIFHRRADSEWKIARYCFSTTNPAPR